MKGSYLMHVYGHAACDTGLILQFQQTTSSEAVGQYNLTISEQCQCMISFEGPVWVDS